MCFCFCFIVVVVVGFFFHEPLLQIIIENHNIESKVYEEVHSVYRVFDVRQIAEQAWSRPLILSKDGQIISDGELHDLKVNN